MQPLYIPRHKKYPANHNTQWRTHLIRRKTEQQPILLAFSREHLRTQQPDPQQNKRIQNANRQNNRGRERDYRHISFLLLRVLTRVNRGCLRGGVAFRFPRPGGRGAGGLHHVGARWFHSLPARGGATAMDREPRVSALEYDGSWGRNWRRRIRRQWIFL